MFLLGPVVLAFACHSHSEQIAIKLHAGIGVLDDDRGVVNTKEQFVGRSVPFGGAFVRRELKNLDGMFIWVFEIESEIPAAFLFQSGKLLRPEDACSTFESRKRAYALSISLTMIAMC